MNNKEKIFQVSIDLFSKYGYDGVSVRQIAREVGIKESSIYNHYSSKQAILNRILEYYVEEMTSDEIPLDQASLNLDRGFDFFYKAGCVAAEGFFDLILRIRDNGRYLNPVERLRCSG